MFWNWIKYFTTKEKWGDVNNVSPLLIWVLDLIRYNTKYAIVIHCAYDTKGHETNSMHYKGLAVDFHFNGCSSLVPIKKILEVLDSLKINYGIGYYRDWFNKGYHVDICRDKTTYWIHDKDYKCYYDKNLFLQDLNNENL